MPRPTYWERKVSFLAPKKVTNLIPQEAQLSSGREVVFLVGFIHPGPNKLLPPLIWEGGINATLFYFADKLEPSPGICNEASTVRAVFPIMPVFYQQGLLNNPALTISL